MQQNRYFGGVYLDHNATTPPATRVLEKVGEWAQVWGNPSSIHWAGRAPKALMREARSRVASFLGATPLEIIFTSCGTESNNLVVKGVFEALHPHGFVKDGRSEVIVSQVEHPALLKAVHDLERVGVVVHEIPVGRDGAFDVEAFEKVLSERTFLVSVMFANNETGNIFPIKKLAKAAHQVGALFHTDATQALGKALLNVSDLGVDFATFSAHKFYALRGAGVLYAHRGSPLHPQLLGGGQERHRRGGTENVLAIAALGEMCTVSREELETNIDRMRGLRDQMEQCLSDSISDLVFTGAGASRVANTSSFYVKGLDGETLLMSLDMKGFAVSTGAACSSGSSEPSPVLRAMGLSFEEAAASLRVSLGWETTLEDVTSFIQELKEIVARLRSSREKEQQVNGL